MPSSAVETVRASFDAYIAQDRAAADAVLADDLVFTSPQDDHIDKAAFLERCFPTVDRLAWQRIVELVPVGDDGAFLMYEYALKSGDTYRNVEHHTVRDGQIVEIQVFFGGRVQDS